MVAISESLAAAARHVGAKTNIDASALLAVALVETSGKAFAMVRGRREPLIRFEGHVFDRMLPPRSRERARESGLANPKAGAVKNPASQTGRWRLLDRAAAIDAEAAYAATSWGLGQIMGMHWKALEFGSATELAETARHSIEGQLLLIARFLAKNGLDAFLRAGDVIGFARRYNGPGFRRNRYDEKIAAALEAAKTGILPGEIESPALKVGARGAAVTALQRALAALGIDVRVDGIFGPATRAAVEAFQISRAMTATGMADEAVLAALGGGRSA
ncbi:N-acetylmuramidase domain-containing protein [Consotaella salsifontis]|uniref:Putative peptidoglycan binding domain-containing protein n=1 Tax=Consotaella salsifontis TaxID=1365950 RepID=A0A1T4NJS7_9HYPH|nr:N-acetylmuramidase domain-containing protein [Consotaella salsifontis]SJZ79316.1 Putative peptidoglycan binding domain-containing protein [Consotaella salsifontis]